MNNRERLSHVQAQLDGLGAVVASPEPDSLSEAEAGEYCLIERRRLAKLARAISEQNQVPVRIGAAWRS